MEREPKSGQAVDTDRISHLEWYPKLYIGISLQRSAAKLKGLIEKRYPTATRYYLLCLPQSEHNQLEIYQAYQLWKPLFDGGSGRIVGICSGKPEALALLKTILDESMRAGYGCDMRRFLEAHWQ
ncbi:MAG: hypothetical protein Q4D52_06105 [Eubacteriales bacterium]|nr:hypothetical protein [Eubacteriales bacterium]